MLAAVNLLGVQPLMESCECNMLRMHCEHCFCYLSPLATESGRLFFFGDARNSYHWENAECFGSHGKTDVSTILRTVLLSFSFTLLNPLGG